MPNLTQSRKDEFEAMIDATTLQEVVEALAEIAFEKAAHLRENWQDERSAKVWEKAGERLNKLVPHIYLL